MTHFNLNDTLDNQRRQQSILDEIVDERESQDDKWGVQDRPLVSPGVTHPVPHYFNGWLHVDQIKAYVDQVDRMEGATLDFASILLEEFAEAVDAPSIVEQRAELVQCAAVVVAAIESIDRAAAK